MERKQYSDIATEKLEQLRGLEDGWNGDDSPAPSTAVLDAGERFLSAWSGRDPAVGPGFDGELEFEWDLAGSNSVFLTMEPDSTVRILALKDHEAVYEQERRAPPTDWIVSQLRPLLG